MNQESLNIEIDKNHTLPIEKREVELVERKGIGHPDSLSDGIGEAISKKLSKEYKDRFGNILHHNTDQVQIVGGRSEPEFGGGEMKEPIFILLSGRANNELEEQEIPTHKIAEEAAMEYLENTVRNIDPEKHVDIDCRIQKGSQDLTGLYSEDDILSNDTSFGVGYAPLSETETIVKNVENTLNSSEFKEKHPYVGEDVKVMGLRRDDNIKITVASAMVDSYIEDPDEYINVVNEVNSEVKKIAHQYTERDIEVYVNHADEYENDLYYITVTGTSAEAGDDGSVGRGNRVNGLITPNRPMSLEAAAGKNPKGHVGKLYNVFSMDLAKTLDNKIEDLNKVHVRTLGQIGRPIKDPLILSINASADNLNIIKDDIEDIAASKLENIEELTERIIADEIKVF